MKPLAVNPAKIIADLIMKGSKVKVINVLNDNMRLKVFKILKKMGGKIKINKISSDKCEIFAEYSYLKNIYLSKNDSTALIDEFPILSIAAACGQGKMVMRGLGELRFKESDRISAISDGLKRRGVCISEKQDKLTIFGKGNQNIKGGSIIDASNDHRIAMSFAILGSITEESVEIRGASSIKTSFPNFIDLMNSLGLNISILKS